MERKLLNIKILLKCKYRFVIIKKLYKCLKNDPIRRLKFLRFFCYKQNFIFSIWLNTFQNIRQWTLNIRIRTRNPIFFEFLCMGTLVFFQGFFRDHLISIFSFYCILLVLSWEVQLHLKIKKSQPFIVSRNPDQA